MVTWTYKRNKRAAFQTSTTMRVTFELLFTSKLTFCFFFYHHQTVLLQSLYLAPLWRWQDRQSLITWKHTIPAEIFLCRGSRHNRQRRRISGVGLKFDMVLHMGNDCPCITSKSGGSHFNMVFFEGLLFYPLVPLEWGGGCNSTWSFSRPHALFMGYVGLQGALILRRLSPMIPHVDTSLFKKIWASNSK